MGYDPEFYTSNKQRYAYYAMKYRDGIRQEMIDAYGGKCEHCGIDDPDVLALDHKNDDAHVEKDLFGENARGGHKIYSILKRQGWPKERFQLLCYNCNARKENKRRRELMIQNAGEEQVSTPETRSKAHANIDPPAHNTSGIKGVFWNNQRGKWQARLMLQYKNIHLGFYDKIEDAAVAYRNKAKEIWGEAAKLPTDEEIAAIAANISKPQIAAATAEDLGL